MKRAQWECWLVGLAALGAVGCAGGSKEPEAPAQEEPPEAALMDEPASEEESSEQTPAADSGEGETFATPQDFQAALQVVIQDDALQKAMNLTEAGRFPIKISGADIPKNIELVAGTEAVEVVSAPEDPKTEPVLVFTSIEITGTAATFKYRYDIEGVRGRTSVTKVNDVWTLESSRISEY